MNDRWVCKRCFADNEGGRRQCHRCGLLRGAESTAADQSAWAARPPRPRRRGRGVACCRCRSASGGSRSWRSCWRWATSRRPSAATTAPSPTAGNLTVADLQVGDCFNEASFDSSGDVEVNDVDAVPCTEPHAYEVYAVSRPQRRRSSPAPTPIRDGVHRGVRPAVRGLCRDRLRGLGALGIGDHTRPRKAGTPATASSSATSTKAMRSPLSESQRGAAR